MRPLHPGRQGYLRFSPEINAASSWFANLKMRLLMIDTDNKFFDTTPSRLMSRNLARAELRRVLKAENEAADAANRLDEQGLRAAFDQANNAVNTQAETAGRSVFANQKVRDLTTEKALNNANSYSCYVMEVPESV